MRRTVRIYFRILGAHLRSTLEYEADFWIMVAAGAFFNILNLLFLSAVFSQVPTINGWTYAECVFISGLYGTIAGLSPLFTEGIWRLSWRVNEGSLDYPLVRPVPVPAQLIGAGIGLHGVGDVLTGGAMAGWALSRLDIQWSVGTVLIGLLLFACAGAIHLSIVTITNLTCFWIRGPYPFLAVAVHNAEDMIRYPLSIYGLGLRLAFTVLIPFAFITYFPVSWLLGRDQAWLGLLTPLVAVYTVFMARTMFRRGLMRYESSGH